MLVSDKFPLFPNPVFLPALPAGRMLFPPPPLLSDFQELASAWALRTTFTHMDDIDAFVYLSHGLCHEVTIGGVDAHL